MEFSKRTGRIRKILKRMCKACVEWWQIEKPVIKVKEEPRFKLVGNFKMESKRTTTQNRTVNVYVDTETDIEYGIIENQNQIAVFQLAQKGEK